MRCPNCGNEIEKGWNFCPRCGARFRRDFFSSVFGNIFSRMDREIREMNRTMEKNIEALDLSPYFRQMKQKPMGSGFSIRIRRLGSSPPRVSVRTFGNMDKEKVRKRIQEQLGTLGLKAREGKPLAYVKKPLEMERVRQFQESLQREPKSVEEPRTEVKRLGNSVIVNLDMPGVKSLSDIEIKELESSLEVKAKAGDRAYFKILTKPGQFRLTKKGFSGGVLHLEFS